MYSKRNYSVASSITWFIDWDVDYAKHNATEKSTEIVTVSSPCNV